MTHYEVSYRAKVNTTISLTSVLAFHDISKQFWDSLEQWAHNELIEEYLEDTGLGEDVKVESKRQLRLDPPTQQNCPSHIERNSTSRDLLEFAGSWVGDDLEECLQAVYDNRTEAKF